MAEAARYSVVEVLRNGRRIEIRALQKDDRAQLMEAAGRASAQSLYRRFFAAKRDFSDSEVAFFVNVDFVNHVALVAVADENGRRSIVGGGRYIVVRPKTAELAFVVIDEFQGQGIGAVLLRHLIAIARDAGLEQLEAEVLPDNMPMLKVFQNSALPVGTTRGSGVVHVTLRLTPTS